MPADILELLPPAPAARGLLPAHVASSSAVTAPAAPSPVFEEWMRRWVNGRSEAVRASQAAGMKGPLG